MASDKILKELSGITHFELPHIKSTIPLECYPNFARVNKEANQRAMEVLGITDSKAKLKFIQSRLVMSGSFAIPRGEDDNRMILASKNMLALFVIDDVFESQPRLAKHLLWLLVNDAYDESCNTGTCVLYLLEFTGGGFQYPREWLFFREVHCELRRQMSPELFQRYHRALVTFVSTVLNEEVENHRLKDDIPDPETYRTMRRRTVFAEGAALLVGEFCLGVKLDKDDYECSDFIDLTDAISDHCALTNDLFSFRKELYSKMYYFNWVSVLINRGLSLQAAISTVCDMILETEANIWKLQKRLVERARMKGKKDLLKFVQAMPLAASGNLRWSFITGRYHGYNNPLITGEPFHGTWLLHPEATIVLQLQECHYSHPFLI